MKTKNKLITAVAKSKLPRGTKTATLDTVDTSRVTVVEIRSKGAVAKLRRELAEVKARELSERLEREAAQRLLRESETLVADLRDEVEYQKSRRNYVEKQREEFDGQSCCATAGLAYTSVDPKNAHSALILALGAHRLAEGKAEYAERLVKALRSELSGERARHEKIRTAIRTWAESYFAADDPARAWVLSMLDPVAEKQEMGQ